MIESKTLRGCAGFVQCSYVMCMCMCHGLLLEMSSSSKIDDILP